MTRRLPGESMDAFTKRLFDKYKANWDERHAADHYLAPGVSISVGVGCFDGNGNKKGSGW